MACSPGGAWAAWGVDAVCEGGGLTHGECADCDVCTGCDGCWFTHGDAMSPTVQQRFTTGFKFPGQQPPEFVTDRTLSTVCFGQARIILEPM